ncbi:hypothetical protein CPB83DRAFT_895400 [Crepidotus variabilis]|uniref:Uncharacterized protein n=1 Tax=Crepidotus variabilis TaxID=179855 RepID=A0A9P6JP29_9AGAR|nr:hypothetical protein CPB83DRAFT_895400 [Crepidotus variabilis]
MTDTFSIELPNELQEIIFKTAARSDGRCALNLLKTARFVHDWVYTILYERVTLCSSASAHCLLRTLRNQYTPRNYALKRDISLPKPLSLTLSYDISQSQAKPIFSQLSKGLITYTIFRTLKNSDHYLWFMKSPFIRRIVLIYQIHSEESSHPVGQYPQEEEIPVGVLSSLSHFALVSDHLRGGCSLRTAFSIAGTPGATLQSPFLRLTCFATSWTRWRTTWPGIIQHAKALRYFAILGPANSQLTESVLKHLRPRKDPRFVFISRGGYGEPNSWKAEDGFSPSSFWSTIEALVKDHYMCDDGEKWSESIVTAFRLKYPEIPL